jgi:hypothetical protein
MNLETNINNSVNCKEMNWEELYQGYLSRCKGKPLNFSEFVRLREGILHKKKIEEKKKEWFEISN